MPTKELPVISDINLDTLPVVNDVDLDTIPVVDDIDLSEQPVQSVIRKPDDNITKDVKANIQKDKPKGESLISKMYGGDYLRYNKPQQILDQTIGERAAIRGFKEKAIGINDEKANLYKSETGKQLRDAELMLEQIAKRLQDAKDIADKTPNQQIKNNLNLQREKDTIAYNQTLDARNQLLDSQPEFKQKYEEVTNKLDLNNRAIDYLNNKIKEKAAAYGEAGAAETIKNNLLSAMDGTMASTIEGVTNDYVAFQKNVLKKAENKGVLADDTSIPNFLREWQQKNEDEALVEGLATKEYKAPDSIENFSDFIQATKHELAYELPTALGSSASLLAVGTLPTLVGSVVGAPWLGVIAGSLSSRYLEEQANAADAYKQSYQYLSDKHPDMTDEEKNVRSLAVGDDVFHKNLPLIIPEILELGLSFLPAEKFLGRLGKTMVGTKALEYAAMNPIKMHALGYLTVAGMQGGEEVFQGVSTERAMNKIREKEDLYDVSFSNIINDPVRQREAISGLEVGWFMKGMGHAISAVTEADDKLKKKDIPNILAEQENIKRNFIYKAFDGGQAAWMTGNIKKEAKKSDGIFSDMTITDEKERMKDASKKASAALEDIEDKAKVYDALKYNPKINDRNRRMAYMNQIGISDLEKQLEALQAAPEANSESIKAINDKIVSLKEENVKIGQGADIHKQKLTEVLDGIINANQEPEETIHPELNIPDDVKANIDGLIKGFEGVTEKRDGTKNFTIAKQKITQLKTDPLGYFTERLKEAKAKVLISEQKLSAAKREEDRAQYTSDLEERSKNVGHFQQIVDKLTPPEKKDATEVPDNLNEIVTPEDYNALVNISKKGLDAVTGALVEMYGEKKIDEKQMSVLIQHFQDIENEDAQKVKDFKDKSLEDVTGTLDGLMQKKLTEKPENKELVDNLMGQFDKSGYISHSIIEKLSSDNAERSAITTAFNELKVKRQEARFADAKKKTEERNKNIEDMSAKLIALTDEQKNDLSERTHKKGISNNFMRHVAISYQKAKESGVDDDTIKAVDEILNPKKKEIKLEIKPIPIKVLDENGNVIHSSDNNNGSGDKTNSLLNNIEEAPVVTKPVTPTKTPLTKADLESYAKELGFTDLEHATNSYNKRIKEGKVQGEIINVKGGERVTTKEQIDQAKKGSKSADPNNKDVSKEYDGNTKTWSLKIGRTVVETGISTKDIDTKFKTLQESEAKKNLPPAATTRTITSRYDISTKTYSVEVDGKTVASGLTREEMRSKINELKDGTKIEEAPKDEKIQTVLDSIAELRRKNQEKREAKAKKNETKSGSPISDEDVFDFVLDTAEAFVKGYIKFEEALKKIAIYLKENIEDKLDRFEKHVMYFEYINARKEEISAGKYDNASEEEVESIFEAALRNPDTSQNFKSFTGDGEDKSKTYLGKLNALLINIPNVSIKRAQTILMDIASQKNWGNTGKPFRADFEGNIKKLFMQGTIEAEEIATRLELIRRRDMQVNKERAQNKNKSLNDNTENISEKELEDNITDELKEKVFTMGNIPFKKIELSNINLYVKKKNNNEYSIAIDNKAKGLRELLTAVLDFQRRDLNSNSIYSPNPRGFILWNKFLQSDISKQSKSKIIVENRLGIAISTLKALKNNGIDTIHFPERFYEDFKEEYSSFLSQNKSSISSGYYNGQEQRSKTIEISINDLVSMLSALQTKDALLQQNELTPVEKDNRLVFLFNNTGSFRVHPIYTMFQRQEGSNRNYTLEIANAQGEIDLIRSVMERLTEIGNDEFVRRYNKFQKERIDIKNNGKKYETMRREMLQHEIDFMKELTGLDFTDWINRPQWRGDKADYASVFENEKSFSRFYNLTIGKATGNANTYGPSDPSGKTWKDFPAWHPNKLHVENLIAALTYLRKNQEGSGSLEGKGNPINQLIAEQKKKGSVLLAPRYNNVTNKSKTAMIMESAIRAKLDNIAKYAKQAFFKANDWVQFNKNGAEYIQVEGMKNIPLNKGNSQREITSNDLRSIMFQLWKKGEDGSFLIPAGKLGDRDIIMGLRAKKYGAQAEAKFKELFPDVTEDEILNVVNTYIALTKGEYSFHGDDIKGTDYENFVYDYFINKHYMDQFLHGYTEQYGKKNDDGSWKVDPAVDVVKRSATLSSTGSRLDTDVEGGLGKTHTQMVFNKLKGLFDGQEVMLGSHANKYTVSAGTDETIAKDIRWYDKIKDVVDYVTNLGKRFLSKTNKVVIDPLAQLVLDDFNEEHGTSYTIDDMDFFEKETDIEGMEYLLLYQLMTKNGVDRLATKDGVKFSISKALDLYKEIDGKEVLNTDLLKQNFETVDAEHENAKEAYILRHSNEHIVMQQDLRNEGRAKETTEGKQMWKNLIGFKNAEKIAAIYNEINMIAIQKRIDWINEATPAQVRKYVLGANVDEIDEQQEEDNDEDEIESNYVKHLLKEDVDILHPYANKLAMSMFAKVTGAKVLGRKILKSLLVEVGRLGVRLEDMRQDADGNTLMGEVMVPERLGLRKAKYYDTPEEAMTMAEKFSDLTDYMHEVREVDGKWKVPGEFVMVTRIPADAPHSHNLMRVEKYTPAIMKNIIITNSGAAEIAGADLDGDQRHTQQFFKTKYKKMVDGEEESVTEIITDENIDRITEQKIEQKLKGKLKKARTEAEKESITAKVTKEITEKVNLLKLANDAFTITIEDYYDKDNYKVLTEAINLKQFDNIVSKLETRNVALNKNNPEYLVKAFKTAGVGLKCVSIGSLMIGTYNIAQKLGVHINTAFSFPQIKIDTGGNLIWDKSSKLSKLAKDISALGNYLNLSLDNLKEMRIELLGLNEETSKMYYVLSMFRPQEITDEVEWAETVAGFFNSEIVKDWVEMRRQINDVGNKDLSKDIYAKLLQKHAYLVRDEENSNEYGDKYEHDMFMNNMNPSEQETLRDIHKANASIIMKLKELEAITKDFETLQRVVSLVDYDGMAKSYAEYVMDKNAWETVTSTDPKTKLKYLDTSMVRDSEFFKIVPKVLEASKIFLEKNSLEETKTGQEVFNKFLETKKGKNKKFTEKEIDVISKGIYNSILSIAMENNQLPSVTREKAFEWYNALPEGNPLKDVLGVIESKGKDDNKYTNLQVVNAYKKTISDEKLAAVREAFAALPEADKNLLIKYTLNGTGMSTSTFSGGFSLFFDDATQKMIGEKMREMHGRMNGREDFVEDIFNKIKENDTDGLFNYEEQATEKTKASTKKPTFAGVGGFQRESKDHGTIKLSPEYMEQARDGGELKSNRDYKAGDIMTYVNNNDSKDIFKGEVVSVRKLGDGKYAIKVQEMGMQTELFEQEEEQNIKPIVKDNNKWGDLKDLEVYSDKGVNATRTSAAKPNEHFGNPFIGSKRRDKNGNLVQAKADNITTFNTIDEADKAYRDWLEGTAHQDIQPLRREWILKQIKEGNLDGKTLLYYKPMQVENIDGTIVKGGYHSHVDTLAEIVEELRGNKEENSGLLNDASDYTDHSGGAKGYDSIWHLIGEKFGMTKFIHYLLPSDGDVADSELKAKGVKPTDATNDVGSVAVTGPATGEGQRKITQAERQMGRIEPTHTTRNTKKIRNWAQVKNADAIFAVGSLIPKGSEITISRGTATKIALIPQVNGGTSGAVQMAINEGKPTYVFNQRTNDSYPIGWYMWSNAAKDFISIDTPTLTKNFAGIGTSSDITKEGRQAVEDVYQKTFNKQEDTTAEHVAQSNKELTERQAEDAAIASSQWDLHSEDLLRQNPTLTKEEFTNLNEFVRQNMIDCL